ncbi:MAG: NAD-dependent epimerase/dehydratase family protein, partial [Rhodospirillales bacterium]|nr:NAD-dependent epimerase/dehydratase family protein [Rhodospirillales bacterium]
MRVLVTGNEGYIGSILVPMLQRAGHEVVGLDVGLFYGVWRWRRLPV